MSVISVVITASVDQTLPGIPNTVAISTSDPATIFYTLDGSSPTTFSPIYVAPIIMPKNLLTVMLNVFATNGVDSSAVIKTQYNAIEGQIPTQAGDRLPHSATTNLNNATMTNSLYPFGTSSPNPNFNYLNPSDAGTTVYDQSQPATSIGFDANGNPAGFSNKPYSTFEFDQKYSTLNSENEITPGVGNLPAKVTVIGKQSTIQYTQERASFADKIFNPRAMVIFQDSTTEDQTNPVHINRPYFSLEDQEVVRDGNLLFNSTLDSPSTMGSFLKSYYNPRTNMLTSYFYDNTVSRWIISTTPYQSTNQNVGALYNMVFGRQEGTNGLYFKWIPFMYRRLI